jgi:hypothetical protein
MKPIFTYNKDKHASIEKSHSYILAPQSSKCLWFQLTCSKNIVQLHLKTKIPLSWKTSFFIIWRDCLHPHDSIMSPGPFSKMTLHIPNQKIKLQKQRNEASGTVTKFHHHELLYPYT